MRAALRGSAGGAVRVDGPRLAAMAMRSRHRIPVIGGNGVVLRNFGPAGLDNHRDPVMASHRPKGER
jgi:hypothetical protein